MQTMNATQQKTAVCFGELLLRLETKNHERLVQAREFLISYTAAEANVAVSLQHFGIPAWLVSAVPPNEIGDACINAFRAYGVNTVHVLRIGSRLGTYYLEPGAAQRPGKIIYDRAHSAITELRPGQVPWDAIFEGKDWFHVSGTSLALTRDVAEVCEEACERARANGVRVSFDINFRSTLWRWDPALSPTELAGKTVRGILPYVDLLITNAVQARDILGIASEDDPNGLCTGTYIDIARRIAGESEQIGSVALTRRESVSASHNRWGAALYDRAKDRIAFAPIVDDRYEPYEIAPMVDRIGAGDAFTAGLIRGILGENPLEDTVAFAVAASCLKHSIPRDFNLVSEREVEALVKGGASGHIHR